MTSDNHYNSEKRILYSSSLMASSSLLNTILGFIRVKIAAILIGSVGIGILAGLNAIQNLITNLTSLGVKKSSVRFIVESISKNNINDALMSIKVLKIFSFILGFFGLTIAIVFSNYISIYIFEDPKYSYEISMLGLCIFFYSISGANLSVLQAHRKVKLIAKFNVFVGVFALISSFIMYSFFEIQGIIYSLILISAFNYILSEYYAKRLKLGAIRINTSLFFNKLKKFISLGLVLMFTSLFFYLSSIITISLINKYFDLAMVGVYSAAFTLSGILVNFILQAMSVDYYPSLTKLNQNIEGMTELVNKQIEISLMMSLSLLPALIFFAPIAIYIFYSNEFYQSIFLIQIYTIGCFFKLASWPIGYIFLAKNNKKIIFISELLAFLFNMSLIYILMPKIGIIAAPIAFTLNYVLYFVIVYFSGYSLINYKFNKKTLNLFMKSFLLIMLSFLITCFLNELLYIIVGIPIVIFLGLYSIKKLLLILDNNKFRKILDKLNWI